jgi:hypothetical protein
MKPLGEIIVEGTSQMLSQVIRLIRRLNVAIRRRWCKRKSRRDNGFYSFTTYDTAETIDKIKWSPGFLSLIWPERSY